MPFYICSKLFHHAHNFEYTLQWAVHNPNTNWLCEAVTLERKLKTKILSISSKEWMPRFANISVALLRHGKNIQWAQKKSLHHINQENIYTKVMFKVIYCKN